MKIHKIDLILIGVLLALVVLEFFIKTEELSHTQVILGIIIGFSVGFKLSAVHGSTVSREAIKMTKKKEDQIEQISDEKNKTEQGYDIELQRKDKLINTLTTNLTDRDEEIKELVVELERIRKD
ncbi:hypothetical protein ACFLRF_05725 [Candidatus Altiarchaeota archaeon]